MTVLVMVKNLLVIKTFYLIIKDCQKLVYNLPFCMSFFLHTLKNYFTLEHGHPKEFSASIFGPVKWLILLSDLCHYETDMDLATCARVGQATDAKS